MPGEESPALKLEWPAFSELVAGLAASVLADGAPDTVVGVLRGGMIPAVQLAHLIGVRSVRGVEVSCTVSDVVNSAKTARPVVVNAGSLGDVAGRDVLVVDDIAGSGSTLAMCRALAEQASPARVRTAAVTVNTANWHLRQSSPPRDVIDYVGQLCGGWVVFPWERT